MRRRYPGLGSQGLGKLRKHDAIARETHYRALCDARATDDSLDLMKLKPEGRASDRAKEAA